MQQNLGRYEALQVPPIVAGEGLLALLVGCYAHIKDKVATRSATCGQHFWMMCHVLKDAVDSATLYFRVTRVL